MKILVTGASGFAGAAIAAALAESGHAVRAAARGPLPRALLGKVEPATLPDLGTAADFGPLCAGMEAIVHAAGLAHQPAGTGEEMLTKVNAEGSARLATAARDRAVGSFLLVSSIRAVAGTSAPCPLVEHTAATPTDAYGRSKREAEQRVAAAFPEAIVLRPPVLHGAGAKANMARLARLARLRLPLPLGQLHGRRSILSDLNLASAVATLLTNPAAAGRCFHVTDGPPQTVGMMISQMRSALGRAPGIVSVPLTTPLLRRLAPGIARQITEDLVVDDTALRTLGWSPVEPSQAGLARMVRALDQTRL